MTPAAPSPDPSCAAATGAKGSQGETGGASRDAPPTSAAELIPPDVAAQLIRESFEQNAEELAATADLLRTPQGLDLLESLPETHPDRAGLRFKVYHLDDEGRQHLVALEWSVALPTEDRLARLVKAGRLPEGEYRVKIWRGRASLPYVVMHIAAPLDAAKPAGVDASGFAVELLRTLTGGKPLLDHGARERKESAALLDDVRQDVSELRETVDGLVQLATQTMQAAQDAGHKPDDSVNWGQLAGLVVDAMTRANQGAAPAPEPNGREVAAGLSELLG